MTASEPWYEIVSTDSGLTQGDLILRCPVLSWDSSQTVTLSAQGGEERLKEYISAYRADVIVMTQACDLEHGKVRNVVLCPHRPISQVRLAWEERMRRMGQNPSDKAWKRYCEDIAEGYVWNQVFLDHFQSPVAATGIRLVDFHELYTIPRAFLESLLRQRNESRLRLRPPYREYLSQAFARFFMRVGLPQGIDLNLVT